MEQEKLFGSRVLVEGSVLVHCAGWFLLELLDYAAVPVLMMNHLQIHPLDFVQMALCVLGFELALWAERYSNLPGIDFVP